MFAFVQNYYIAHFRRREGVFNKSSWVGIIFKNINFFPFQFLDYRLNADALKPDARADRIDVFAV